SELITSLIARGIVVVPVLLHSGVASLEAGEMPEPEPYRVSKSTAGVVNLVHATGGRVIAVGTTAVRALETVASSNGIVHAASGYTDLVIDGERPLRVVDGLVTGWHEPRASHLELVEAVAGVELAAHMYKRALDSHYLWHEFGDSSLILS
ncbi:MAG: S-adenosylmethionine:tRNA ribosyltransferase-isomerase, partial [Acidimicrobiia bacterium]